MSNYFYDKLEDAENRIKALGVNSGIASESDLIAVHNSENFGALLSFDDDKKIRMGSSSGAGRLNVILYNNPFPVGWDGKIYIEFYLYDFGEIYLETSSDGGTSWDKEVELTPAIGTNSFKGVVWKPDQPLTEETLIRVVLNDTNGGAGDKLILKGLEIIQFSPPEINNLYKRGLGVFNIPQGTTTERPVSPFSGMYYIDTDLNATIVYDGTNWVYSDGTAI